MVDRANNNSTAYEHPQESNLFNIHKAMEYNALGQPIIRVTGSTSASATDGIDAFGRQQVAQPYTLFDSQHRYAQNDKYWTSTASGATIAHDANASVVNMNLATTSGSKAVMETTKVFPYQPGKALEIFATFTMDSPQTNLRQRVGYFGTENGVFLEQDGSDVYLVLRSKSSGSVVETRVAQADWNTDTLDGNGPSDLTLDLTKSQILFIDIEWLGVGTVRAGFVINGAFVFAHKFHHANLSTSTYMTTAALPVRYEAEATDTLGSTAQMKHICSTVVSSGGFAPGGRSFQYGRGLTYYTASTAGTFYHLVSLKLNSSRLDDIVIPNNINVLTDSNQNLQYKLVLNATFSTPLSFTTHANGTVDHSVTNTAVSAQGTELATGYIVNKGEAGTFTLEALRQLQLSRQNTTADVLSLIATADSNNTTMTGNFGWLEPLRS